MRALLVMLHVPAFGCALVLAGLLALLVREPADHPPVRPRRAPEPRGLRRSVRRLGGWFWPVPLAG